jgi:hypothetical protein
MGAGAGFLTVVEVLAAVVFAVDDAALGALEEGTGAV